MKLFLFVVLAGYAVKCDDSNYYVIEMPEDDPPQEVKKPFRVYWNVPTMQCKSKGIPFENLHNKYGIIQNKNDSFRGERIAILYDPGSFPALLKNESTGEVKFRNGGVPQEGDIEKHIMVFRSVLEQSVPDPNFSGVGIIDFESWRPVFRQNFGTLVPYKEVSYSIERKRHWLWPKSWIEAEAKKRFEENARMFMQTTLSIAKQMRPNALWGYYGFPYCFNMAANTLHGRCADKVPTENDHIRWLWLESSALYPSVYSSSSLSPYQLYQLISGRVKEAARVRKPGAPILPYFWYRYHTKNREYFRKDDLQAAIKTLYQSDASGFIIWGSSNDVNTKEKCIKLHKYVEEVLGPTVAEYTIHRDKVQKPSSVIDLTNDTNNSGINKVTTTTTTVNPLTNETVLGNNTSEENGEETDPDNNTENTFSDFNDSNTTSTTTLNLYNEEIEHNVAQQTSIVPDNVITTTMTSVLSTDLDVDWNIPENNTEPIIRYVEEELNTSSNDKNVNNKTVLRNINESVLIDLILNTLIVNNEKNESTNEDDTVNLSKNNKKGHPNQISTLPDSQVTTPYDLEFSGSLVTESSLLRKSANDDKQISKHEMKSPRTTINPYKIETTTGKVKFLESDIFVTEHYVPDSTDNKLNTEDTRLTVDNKYTTTNLDIETYESSTFNDKLVSITEKPFKNRKKGYPKLRSQENNEYTSLRTEEKESTLFTDSIINSFNTEKPSKDKKKGLPLDKTVTYSREHISTTTENTLDVNEEISTTESIVTTEDGITRNLFNRKNRRKGLPKSTQEDIVIEDLNLETLTTVSSLPQVDGGTTSGAEARYYFCIFIYFYSVSKCLCDVYGQC